MLRIQEFKGTTRPNFLSIISLNQEIFKNAIMKIKCAELCFYHYSSLESSIHNSSKAIKGQSLKLSLPYISRTVNKKMQNLQNKIDLKLKELLFSIKKKGTGPLNQRPRGFLTFHKQPYTEKYFLKLVANFLS